MIFFPVFLLWSLFMSTCYLPDLLKGYVLFLYPLLARGLTSDFHFSLMYLEEHVETQ
jgi:hypothetical protein